MFRNDLKAGVPGRSGASVDGITRRRSSLTRWDLAGMLAGFLFTLIVAAVLQRGRIFWEDEMLGWMMLRDPSWRHMLLAYNAGADGGGFTFYLTGRAWLQLFGHSALAFRLYSASCFGLAFAVSWAAMRRFYGTGIVAFALFNTWFFSAPFVEHMAEGRFYGLLVLGVSLAIWLVFALAEAPRPTPAHFYVLMFGINALLTTSHLLGVVFSGFLLLATIVLDAQGRRLRPLLYLAGAASWMLLLPERTNIHASAAVGKPHFWTIPPGVSGVIAVYTGTSKEMELLLALLFCVAAMVLVLRRGDPPAPLQTALAERRPVYVVLVTLLVLLPAAFFAEGLVGTWLFNDRYLLPLTVGIAYVTVELVQLIRSNLRLGSNALPVAAERAIGAAVAVVFVVTMMFWDFRHLRNFSESPQDYTTQLTAMLPKGLPVVCEDAFCFTDLIGRQHASGVPFVYLLDWNQSLNPTAPRLEVTQYHLMENWRNVGYFSGSIQPVGEFLQRNGQFLVVHTDPFPLNNEPPIIGNPIAERLAHDPAYRVVPFAELTRYGKRDSVFLVCRGRCDAVPRLASQ
ncbi:MAG: ArnT family glycosyltransferase [Janthinobacterium lividum]